MDMGKRRKKQHTVVEDISFSGLKKHKEKNSKNKPLLNKVTKDHSEAVKKTKLQYVSIHDTTSDEIPTLQKATKEKSSKTVNLSQRRKYVTSITSNLSTSGKTDHLTYDDAKETRQAIKKTKKNKTTAHAETLEDNIAFEEKNMDSNKKNKKKRKQNLGHDEDTKNVDLLHEHENANKKSKQNLSKDQVVLNKQSKISNDPCEKKKKKKSKRDNDREEVINDEDIEVLSNEQNKTSNACEKKTKNRKHQIVEEEELVNDEDIDRYCDELDEVHNKQYEDWVKLIEANLKSNKHV